MLTGFYSGVSGIYYNEQRLAATANNMANANTTGFRKALMTMSTREQHPFHNQVDSAVRKRLPNIYGAERSGVFVNHKETGQLRQTNNDMHVALAPELKNGFLSVNTGDPSDGVAQYTRNGTLSFGALDPANPVSPTVLKVSGYNALDADKQPIQIDPSKGPIAIAPDGTLSQGEEIIGQLPVFRLNKSSDPTNQESANLNGLNRLGDSLYSVPEERSDEFHPFRLEVGQPGVNRLMSQGMLEGSNVNIFQEMVEMMNSTQATTAGQTSINTQLNGLNKLFQMIRR